MGKIAVHEFISLDGVVEDPRWTADYPFDPKMGEAIGAITLASQAILLGRRTYEMFAPAWSARTAEEDPGAPFFNDTPKYVVSATLQRADWNNSEIVGPYDAETIRTLKDRPDGDLYVSGSVSLVRRCSPITLSMSSTCSSTRSSSAPGCDSSGTAARR